MFSICESHFDFAAANPSRVSTLAIWSAPYAAFNAVVADDDAPPVTFTNAYWSRGRGSERSNVAFGITMALNSESSFGAVKMPTAFSVVARPSGPRKTNESARWMTFAFANRSLTTASLPWSDASDAPSTATSTTFETVAGSTPLMPAFADPTRPRSPRTCESSCTPGTLRPASAANVENASQPFWDVTT